MKIETPYDIWEVVYLRTDKDNKKRIITAIEISSGTLYKLSFGMESSWHSEAEISRDKDSLEEEKKMGFNKN